MNEDQPVIREIGCCRMEAVSVWLDGEMSPASACHAWVIACSSARVFHMKMLLVLLAGLKMLIIRQDCSLQGNPRVLCRRRNCRTDVCTHPSCILNC